MYSRQTQWTANKKTISIGKDCIRIVSKHLKEDMKPIMSIFAA